MRVGDLVSVARVPTVVQLPHIADLRDQMDLDGDRLSPVAAERLRALVGEYIISDAANATAVRAVLGSLGEPNEGGAAFLIEGAPGAGKSHFLAVLGLLLEYSVSREVFAKRHRDFLDVCSALERLGRLLVVPVALDEHRGRSEFLEDIIFDETESELRRPKYDIFLPLSAESHALDLIDRHVAPRYLEDLDQYVRRESGGARSWANLRASDPARAVHVARQFLSDINYPLDFRQSRAERLRRLTEVLARNNFRGVVWLVDELSMFLESVDAKALSNDCAFLQFIGQSARTEPVWLIGAMRRGLEAVTELDHRILTQIRERYNTDLALSAAEVMRVVRERVVRVEDRDAFGDAMAALHGELRSRFPQLTFTEEELAASYPLHPLTMRCLQAASEQLWSRARSAIDFAAARIGGDPGRSLPGILDQDYRALLTPDVLFDHFRSSLSHHERLGTYASDVYDYFVKNVASIVQRRSGLALRAVKTLIILRVANLEATVREVAQCVLLAEPPDPRGDEEAMRELLELLATRGTYVHAKRAEGAPSDVYVVDAYPSPIDVAQRQVRAAKAVLADDDARIEAHAHAACATDLFPIARFATKQTEEVQWENTRRKIAIVHVNLASLTSSDLADAMTWLRSPDTAEDAQLYIGTLLNPDQQLRHWADVCEALAKTRWRNALVAWVPRGLRAAELDLLKEFAAAQMVRQGAADDAGEQPRAARDVEAMLRDVYCDGAALTAGGISLAPGSLPPLKAEWPSILRRLAGLALSSVFPRFHDIAPTARLGPDAPIEELRREIIFAAGPVPPAQLAAPLETALRSYLEPLGVAARDEAGVQLSTADSEVASTAEHLVSSRDPTDRAVRGRPVPVGRIVGQMAKSEFGLPPELSRLLIAVLLRCGHVVALDPKQHPIPPDAPFGRIGYLARAPLLSHNEWRELAGVSRVILGEGVLAPNVATQQLTWDRLIAEKRKQSSKLVELSSKLDSLCLRLGHERGQWADSYDALEEARAFFACIDPSLPSAEGLRELLAGCRQLYLGESVGPSLRALAQNLNQVDNFLNQFAEELADTHEYVLGARVPEDTSSILRPARERLLDFLNDGERVVGEWRTFQRLAHGFIAGYIRAYLAWHQRFHNAPEFQQYDKLRSTPAYRALAQMAQLEVPTRLRLKDIEDAIDEQLAKQCSNEELADQIKSEPVCPRCKLSLADPLELKSPQELAELIREALAGQLSAIQRPQTRSALLDHAASLPADLAGRVRAVAELSPDADPTRVLSMLSDEMILHLKRALTGRAVHGRQLDDLRHRVSRRTLTKSAIAAELQSWLDGDDDLPDDELIYVE